MGGTVEVISGWDPVSHRAGSDIGVFVLHCLTGNPSSLVVRSVTS